MLDDWSGGFRRHTYFNLKNIPLPLLSWLSRDVNYLIQLFTSGGARAWVVDEGAKTIMTQLGTSVKQTRLPSAHEN